MYLSWKTNISDNMMENNNDCIPLCRKSYEYLHDTIHRGSHENYIFFAITMLKTRNVKTEVL